MVVVSGLNDKTKVRLIINYPHRCYWYHMWKVFLSYFFIVYWISFFLTIRMRFYRGCRTDTVQIGEIILMIIYVDNCKKGENKY